MRSAVLLFVRIIAYSEPHVKINFRFKRYFFLTKRKGFSIMDATLNELKVAIGRRIKFYRQQRGLTQMELAAKVGYTSKAAISEIESGKKAPSMDMLQAVADTLKVPVSVLVTPINFDGFDKKNLLFADFVFLLSKTGETPVLDVIHTIVKTELDKLK
jgi:transcriptional regulator with XRE-family HTH domain